MQSFARITKTPPSRSPPQLLTFSLIHLSSNKTPKVPSDPDAEFLPWLENKAGAGISSKLYIANSAYGRSCFASTSIRPGDCILKVPYNVQLSADNLLPEVKSLLSNIEVDNITRLAIVVLAEKGIGQESQWTPYISCLPPLEDMHSTIFWSESELVMIRASLIYQETLELKAQLESDFYKIEPVLERLPNVFGDVALTDFMHAYALVVSRAWGNANGASMIPFADFLNHDGISEAVVLNDDTEQISEVVADRDYAPHEEVLISYGKFGNETLILQFGFTLPFNIHDQVQLPICIPDNDHLREAKFELLQKHHIPTIKDVHGFANSYIIKEVRSAIGKGKGLPQSLRAFARVLCCNSRQELNDLAVEAALNDGRLARRPFKDIGKEILSHQLLLSHFTYRIKEYDASIKSLEAAHQIPIGKAFALRKLMALDLLKGELRILKSASAWLKNYSESFSRQTAVNNTNVDHPRILE